MDDRERLEAIVKVVRQYLPPNGISIKEAMGKIIELVDPLPPKREWVGIEPQEIGQIWANHKEVYGFGIKLEQVLKERNT